MPSNAPIQFNVSTPANGYCPASYAQLFIDIAAALSGFLPGTYSTFVFGPNEPAVADRDKPWIRTIGSPGPIDRIYAWNGTYWASPFFLPDTSIGFNFIWKQSLSDLAAWENPGGTVGQAVTSYSGPWFEEDTDMRGVFPIGPGTMPSTAVIAVNGTGGHEEATLSASQGAFNDHVHGIGWTPMSNNDIYIPRAATLALPAATNMFFVPGDGNAVVESSVSNANLYTTQPIQDGVIGGVLDPVSFMPPYRGRYFIKRTARLYYKAP